MRPLALATTCLVALAAGCTEVTEPRGEFGLYVVHAAPGAGTWTMTIDNGVRRENFGPGDVVAQTLPFGLYEIAFQRAGAETVSWAVHTFTPGRWAVLLTDPDDPRIVSYWVRAAEPVGDLVTLTLINLVPGSQGLTVTLVGAVTVVEMNYTSARSMGLLEGRYDVIVSDPASSESVELGAIEIPRGGAFVLIMPGEAGELAGRAIVF